MGMGEFERSMWGVTHLQHSCQMHLPGLSSKTGQKRGFYGKCGSFPQGSGAVLAGDVEPGPSLCSGSGDEESRANSLLWKEVEIKQIHVYPVPSIGFVLSQLKNMSEWGF